jgi:hypothetical protein
MTPTDPEVGLCAECEEVRVIESARGTRFYLCELSVGDPRYRKYPPLPVLACAGFRARSTKAE